MHGRIPTQPIILGRIGSCYGIQGWLKIFSFTEKRNGIFDYQPWFIQKANQWYEIKLENWSYRNQNIIIKLKNICNRNTASTFTNCEVIIDSSQLPQLEAGSYYYKDLIGCQVLTIENFNLGKISKIIEIKSNYILVVKENLKDKFIVRERMIPFVYEHIIKEIDLVNQTIKVNWDPVF